MNGGLWAIAAVLPLAATALWFQRRRHHDPPTPAPLHSAPSWVDPIDVGVARADPADPESLGTRGDGGPWLVVLFSSVTCGGCEQVWDAARVLASDQVAVRRLDFTEHPDLHERYQITGVPTLVIADRTGMVRKSYVGAVSATHLWAAVAEIREPGSVPPGCGGDH